MTEKPSLYLIYGDDMEAIRLFVGEMLARMGDDPGMVELNTARFDGHTARVEEVSTAAQAMPFLAERRLVIVEQAHELDKKGDRLLPLLDALPASTALVLVIADELVKKNEWKHLKASHYLRKWVTQAGGRAYLRECRQPEAASMPGWIVNKAKALGGKIEQPAAKELATYVGSDTLAATRELEKLLTYVDYHRAVELADVQAVSIDERQGDIFQMIDQMAVGNRREALRLLGLLLQEQDAMALFGMVIRQFRLLIVTRELLDEGRPLAQLNSYGVHQDFLWRKYGDQARRFSLEQLTGIYRRLLEMDLAAKTGGMALDLSLQTLIAEL